MKRFKDYLDYDINNTFFNQNEFSEPHKINGKNLNIIIDNDELGEHRQRVNKYFSEPQGIYKADVLFYVKKSNFGDKPAIGENLRLDNNLYQVADAEDDGNVLIISLMGRFS